LIEKNARDVAVSAITAFRKRSAWSEGFLRNEIRSGRLSPKDAALATEIVNGVLQNKLLIDYYIKTFSSLKFNKISPGILDILEMAIYQIVFLDRVPDSAAVNDAVNRAKKNNPKAAGFVNAITRKISSAKDSLPEIRESGTEKLSIKYSHPLWLAKKFVSVFGEETAEEILKANNKKIDVFVRVNTLKAKEEDVLDIDEEGMSFEKGIVPDSLILKVSGAMEQKKAFSDGLFYVQDTASQIAALTLNPKPESRVLDACSAPGGKSFLMAQLMENRGEIVSCDIHPHKLKLISDGAQRLGINIIRTKLSDATEFNRDFVDTFDYILADVPCSGLGIIRKKPDIRYKDGNEIEQLPVLQLEIIKNLSNYLRSGGTLLYSTCTILPEENSDVIEMFLSENKDFFEVEEYFDISCVKNKYGITLLPHMSKTDGFYMCKLRRK